MEQQDLRVGNKYRIGRKIGSGSFGDIYLGKASPHSLGIGQGSPFSPHTHALSYRHQHHLW